MYVYCLIFAFPTPTINSYMLLQIGQAKADRGLRQCQ